MKNSIRYALIFLVLAFVAAPARGQDCSALTLIPEDHAYHIYPIHHGRCPDGETIQCHKYHWHWVCERQETLYWDRRKESAARAACGCPPADGVAPASPAVSGKPFENLIDSDGKNPVDLERLRERENKSPKKQDVQ